MTKEYGVKPKGKATPKQLSAAQKAIKGLERRRECDSCGMPMNSKGTIINGDKFCRDCVQEGKYAAELITERNKLLKKAAEIERQVEDMGYVEYIKPDYDEFLLQEDDA